MQSLQSSGIFVDDRVLLTPRLEMLFKGTVLALEYVDLLDNGCGLAAERDLACLCLILALAVQQV